MSFKISDFIVNVKFTKNHKKMILLTIYLAYQNELKDNKIIFGNGGGGN